MKKRFLSLLTAAIMALSLCVPACAAAEDTGFTDVSPGA